MTSCYAQKNVFLHLKSTSNKQDSLTPLLNERSEHENYQALLNYIQKIEDDLNHKGYLSATKTVTQIDSLVTYQYEIGPKTNFIGIKTHTLDSLAQQILQLDYPQTLTTFENTTNLLNKITSKLESNGYGTSGVTLKNHRISNDTLWCTLYIEQNKKRIVNSIKIISQDKIPYTILQTSLKPQLNSVYSQSSVEKINTKLTSFKFIELTKPSETLFTQDSTAVYVYLNKKNNNQFDGYVGFSNEENGKLKLNGYLDLELNNILNKAESTTIKWRNNGEKQTEFYLKFERPYLFKTPLALKGSLEIQKQDSTYQNTKLNYNLGYFLNTTNKIFLGYQTTNSAVSENPLNLESYTSKFILVNYQYIQHNSQRDLYPIDKEINLTLGSGSRNSESHNNKQNYVELIALTNIPVSKTSLLYIKWNSYLLQSDTYYFNELKRFGGFESLRGFQENSLTAQAYSIINTEYRLTLGTNLSLYTILDYAIAKDPIRDKDQQYYALGAGMGLLTNNTLFKIALANGSSTQERMNFQNSTIHISLSTFF